MVFVSRLMQRVERCYLFVVRSAIGLVFLTTAGIASEKPNILFILTDDQGWTSLGCYGNDLVPTPHLDQLASEGVRFTDAYVMPQCTPTRAALLTGQHTARNGMWHVIGWYGSPWARMTEPAFVEHLPPEQCQLPHRLRGAGYRTGMAGKWHLTNNAAGHYVYLKEEAAGSFGFDYVAPPGQGSQNEGDKWVDHLTDRACDFVARNRDRPWFFYLSHHTLHGKVSAPQALVDKHLATGAPAEGMHNATYLAAIEHLDNSIGRLLAKLDETGQRENTIVVFLSDNGGVDTSYALPAWSDQPLDGSQPLKADKQEFDNAPLREGKGSVYEGGIRVPCIVRWPAKVPAGRVDATPIHVVDWMPTLLAAANDPLAESDGVDLLPLLQGSDPPKRPLYWYMPLYDLRWASTPSAIIREGKWKLIEYFGDRFDSQQQYRIGPHVELYNLAADLGETTNLAGKDPQRATRMQNMLHRWLQGIPAEIPSTNPHYDPAKAFLETREKQPWNH